MSMQDLLAMVSQQEILLVSLILVVTFSMLWLVAQSTVASPQTKSLLSLVSLLLARLSFALGLSSIFLNQIPMLG